MAILHAQVYLSVVEGLTLSLPVTEIHEQPPDHGHHQAEDHPVLKSLCM